MISRLFLLSITSLLFAQDPTKGIVTGLVLDAGTGQPIRAVQISIEGQTGTGMSSDLEGRYKLVLSPGKYNLKFAQEAYNETAIEVEIAAGQVLEASTVMSNKNTVTSVDVTEKVGAVAATAEAMLAERRLAAAVSDAISSEEIKRSTASDAAGAVQKVTGVSIVDNGFVYVRGLGERYSSTMLNSAMIPTTEPEKRVVPLDLFPASLIESIKILKTYNPDLPGEFAGGLVQMQTMEFPTTPVFRVGVSYGFNSRTTFNRFSTYRGGSRDIFGFDNGTRSIPGVIPSDSRLIPGVTPSARLQEFGRAFDNNWDPEPIESMRPQQTYNIAGGRTFGKLGLVGAVTFTSKPQFIDEIQNYYVVSGRRQQLFTEYGDFRTSNETAKLGAVLNAAYRINDMNKIVFRNTLTRDSDKEARMFGGFQGGISSDIQSTRLRWIERGLISTGLEGEHAISKFRSGLLRWQMTFSSSQRDEPDLREVFRGLQSDNKFEFLALPASGLRFFNKLQDRIFEPLAEWSQPFFKGKVSAIFKFGFRGTFRERDFEARRFRFVPIRSATLNFALPSNQLFAASNIRPDGFEVRELTRATDSYDAMMDVYAGFTMVDLALGSKWRIIGGVRIEDAAINVTTIDPLIPGARPVNSRLNNRDALPGVNAIYALTGRQNLRFGYSKTVSRPDFRELSPFDFNNVLGGFNVVGNPDLKRAKIDNLDVRWEWFPSSTQVVAVSYFFKRFKDPIEIFIDPAQELRQSFLNADSARNQGIELELRKNLGFLAKRMRPFEVQANFTVVGSNVTIPQAFAALLTSKSRPLMGQSRYIYNFIAEWNQPKYRSNARFYANSVSRRITDVGTVQLPDIYQERNTFLDFVYQYDIKENGKWTIRFAAENMGDNQYRWTQGGFLQRQYQLGRTISIGTSFSII
ncbi:MAG: TonB-dependent receptor [Acidobacteria bacterium]|nr:TonB-dependent receptor [Acidobacteriota bacterium]